MNISTISCGPFLECRNDWYASLMLRTVCGPVILVNQHVFHSIHLRLEPVSSSVRGQTLLVEA
jgi:hypothetical protein